MSIIVTIITSVIHTKHVSTWWRLISLLVLHIVLSLLLLLVLDIQLAAAGDDLGGLFLLGQIVKYVTCLLFVYAVCHVMFVEYLLQLVAAGDDLGGLLFFKVIAYLGGPQVPCETDL